MVLTWEKIKGIDWHFFHLNKSWIRDIFWFYSAIRDIEKLNSVCICLLWPCFWRPQGCIKRLNDKILEYRGELYSQKKKKPRAIHNCIIPEGLRNKQIINKGFKKCHSIFKPFIKIMTNMQKWKVKPMNSGGLLFKCNGDEKVWRTLVTSIHSMEISVLFWRLFSYAIYLTISAMLKQTISLSI